MTFVENIFYFFAVTLIVSALGVVLNKNAVKAALSLILAFFSAAIIWLLLEAEFLAITLVLVYVGAVMVLFLFVVMMLDVELITKENTFSKHFWLGAIVATLSIWGLTIISQEAFIEFNTRAPILYAADYSNVKVLARLLFSEYLYPFEIAGILLLVAIIAAITLTFRGKQNRKSQIISEQVKVKSKDRITLIDMPIEGNQ